MGMNVLILCRYYASWFTSFYEKRPHVSSSCYQEHYHEILNEYGGWPAQLSNYMNKQGIETTFILTNAQILQKQWAQENNFLHYSSDNWEKEIALEQVKRFRPDVLWIIWSFDFYGSFALESLRYTKKIITWIGSPFVQYADMRGVSVLLTENRSTLRPQHDSFEKVIVTKPGFDRQVLDKLDEQKKYDVTFVGSLTPAHIKRLNVLAYLAQHGIDIQLFVDVRCLPRYRFSFLQTVRIALGNILKRGDIKYGFNILYKYVSMYAENNRFALIDAKNRSPIFGIDMLRVLQASRIVFNSHIDCAGDNSGNMRIFEGTGVGSCLVTEYASNISNLFKPGKEILIYQTQEELLEILQNMKKNESKINQIARAGQQRTLQNHSLERMFDDIKDVF